MKRFIVIMLASLITFNTQAQNLSKVKDAIVAKKYKDANVMIDEFLKNPKYQKNVELFYLKAKSLSEISIDSVLSKDFPGAGKESLELFKKVFEMDKGQATLFNSMDGSQQIFNLYANPYNVGIKYFNEKVYDKALVYLKEASQAGQFIFDKGLGLSKLDTNLVYYTAYSALLSKQEDEAAKYFRILTDADIKEKGFEDAYKNLMNYYFTTGNNTEFENIRTKGLSLFPKDEYFTYTDVVFITDMKDKDKQFKLIEEKVGKDPNNKDAVELYAQLLFDKLFGTEGVDTKTPEFAADEAKLIAQYNKLSELSPNNGIYLFSTALVHVNKGFKLDSKISDVNDKIREFNNKQKPDKAGKIPPPPAELTALRDNLRAEKIAAYDLGLPYLIKAQPLMEKAVSNGKAEFQNYRKLIDILVEVYSSKRQFAKLPADKTKFEAEEGKWNKEYDRLSQMAK